MRLASSVLAAAAFAATAYSANAFQPTLSSMGHRTTGTSFEKMTEKMTALSSTATDEASPCAIPNDVIPDSVTARGLRSAVLTNIDGEKVRLDQKMGKGTSIVIFLRHLG